MKKFFSKKPGNVLFMGTLNSLLLKNLSSPPRPTTPATVASPTNRKLGGTGEKIGETALVLNTERESRLKRSGRSIFEKFSSTLSCFISEI